jgi:hypothetical protein
VYTQGVAAPSAFAGVDLVLRISEDDVRIVEAYYDELALEASRDRSPPTPEEQIELEKLAASSERLKAMTRPEMLALRARRLRQLRRFE